ncbi:SDR family oxidoreductase [Arenicella xantha]|uniref:NAD(P)-dependent dehydrogenase (Short-subunit alcohol dehydrogenase family) n=1 Tax=Arenicella xantha TaxID=644221 RepID=A0A395JLG1_9GAMM|nr:SDR family oxidoreductase [Arenicella xantha]RBP50687.1 NAD(P)-dependent dehydrogenase (short-subunit alcohol dehydrogenase family) [Arenicella xantha]
MTTNQITKPREFTKTSTATDVTEGVDLAGKNIVVTGINSGLGLETMRVLTSRGAHIIGTARTKEKAATAAASIDGKVTTVICELSDFGSVRQCADQVNALDLPIDGLICNAGIMALPKLELANGFEQQFNTNHLGHFILVNRLLDSIKRADQGRIVMLSSLAHKMAPLGGILFDNLDGSKWYKDWPFYGQSKLANMLTALALSARLEGSSATANAVHPGIIRTNLSRNMGGIQGVLFNNPISGWFVGKMLGTKTIAQGAATQCYVATAPELSTANGKYFADCSEERPSRYGQSVDLAEQLWSFSYDAVKPYIE